MYLTFKKMAFSYSKGAPVVRSLLPTTRPPQRHMERRKSRIFILFWPLSGLVIYSGGFWPGAWPGCLFIYSPQASRRRRRAGGF